MLFLTPTFIFKVSNFYEHFKWCKKDSLGYNKIWNLFQFYSCISYKWYGYDDRCLLNYSSKWAEESNNNWILNLIKFKDFSVLPFRESTIYHQWNVFVHNFLLHCLHKVVLIHQQTLNWSLFSLLLFQNNLIIDCYLISILPEDLYFTNRFLK